MSLKTEKTCSAELAVVITLPIFIQMSLKMHCYDVNLSVENKSKLKELVKDINFQLNTKCYFQTVFYFLSHLSWNQKPDLSTLRHLAQNTQYKQEFHCIV